MKSSQRQAEIEAWLARLTDEHGPEIAAACAERLADELAETTVDLLSVAFRPAPPPPIPLRSESRHGAAPRGRSHGSEADPHRVPRAGGPCVVCGARIEILVDAALADRVRQLRAVL